MRFPPNLEADYQTDLGPEKMRVLKMVCMLVTILYPVFGILDLWAMPSSYQQVWAIRAVVVMLTLLVVGLAKWWPQGVLSRYTAITWTAHLVWGMGILAMIALADPRDLGWSSYYCGLLLVCTALPLNYLALLPIMALGTTYVVAYLFVAVFDQGMLGSEHWPLLMMNSFFLISTTILAIVVVTIRERYSRDIYLLRHSLQRDVETTKEAKRQSDFLAEHDTLTGMPNRISFLRRLEAMMEHADDTQATATVLFIDLDGFKPINDNYGHRVGDVVLTVVAERIRLCVREADATARIGGDEFVVAVELDRRHKHSIDRLRKNLADAISSPIAVDGHEVSVAASIGMATYPGDADNAVELVHVADVQMYEAKRNGKTASCPDMPTAVMQGYIIPLDIADSTASHSW